MNKAMYKVLIVDDDVSVLTFLSTMIPWNEHGFELIGTSTNAYDALEVSEVARPDLIITDIGMPGMSGLELIRTIKHSPKHPRFLILSCHDEFHFAQQAVKLGVQDYLLKETLSIENMQKILETIFERIDAENLMKKKVEKLHYQAIQSKSGLKEKWFRDFLTTPFLDHDKWRQQLSEFGLKTELKYYIPVVCSLYLMQDALVRYKTEDMLKFILDNAMQDLLQQEPDVISFSYTAGEFCLIFAFNKNLSVNHYEWVHRVCQSIQQSLASVLKIQVSILLSNKESDCLDIQTQFTELLQATDLFFYSAQPEIVKLSEARPLSNQEDLLAFYSDYVGQIHRLILEENTEVRSVVKPFIDFITKRRFMPMAVKQFVFRLKMDLQLKLTFNQQYNNEKMQSFLGQMSNVSELEEWMTRFLEEAVSVMGHISKQSRNLEIVEAKKYVMLHLHQKITLGEVADHLYLNSSYFSRLFKKETGENFIEYVTRVKMERAKELLNDSNKTIEEVARSVGYDNRGYFVKLFRSQYGAPPSQFIN